MSRPASAAATIRSAQGSRSALGSRDPSTSENWAVALSESRGVGREVGIAGIEKELGKCVVSQLADSQTYIKTVHWLIQRVPTTILLPASGPSSPSVLEPILANAFPDASIHTIERSLFNDQNGLAAVSRLMSTASSADRTATISHVRLKYYALGAANAVVEWLARQGMTWSKGCLDVQWRAVEGTMLMDNETIRDLELLTNILDPKSNQSLFGLLNHCHTPMGVRMLRAQLLAPSTDVDTIEARLDAVHDLVTNEERFISLRQSVKLIQKMDAEKLIGSVASCGRVAQDGKGWSNANSTDPSVAITRKMQMLLSLRQVIKSIPAIAGALTRTTTALLVRAEAILRDEALEDIASAISECINEDAAGGIEKGALAVKNTKVFAVRAHSHQFLDVARETYKENVEDTVKLADEIKERFELDGLQVKFEQGAGFLFTIRKEDLEGRALPALFTNVVQKGKQLRFTCLDLKKKNQRIAESYQEICLLSVLDELIDRIKQRLSVLFRVSEAIGLLDMIASFASIASTQHYARPEFTDTLAVINGRHPAQERFRFDLGSFVPNDVYMTDACSFQIITGPNMSGKSTFLRQVAMLVVMAQVGSYVPGEYASFMVHDALLSRLSNDDDIEAGLSTFAAEMRTMATILSAITVCRCPLIIIDELGRGTSPIEGVGLAHAIAQELIETGAYTFFATHFRELVTTLSVYPNAVCLHLETEIEKNGNSMSLKFHHRVVDGPTKQTNYGLQLARLAALPPDVLAEAERVTGRLEELEAQGKRAGRASAVIARRGVLLDVTTTLRQIMRHSRISGQGMKKLLVDLQNDTITRLAPSSSSDMASSSPRNRPQPAPEAEKPNVKMSSMPLSE